MQTTSERSWTGDRGQASTDHLGLVVLVAAAVAALLALGVPALVADGLERAVCTVLQREGCGSGSGPTPDDPDAPPVVASPVEVATAGTYVGIGDSFSSGEGAYDYEASSDTEGNRCHRSANAYAQVIAGDLDFVGGVDVVSCSGARVTHVLEEGQNGEPRQLDAIDEGTSLVTLGIGGNDAKWAKVLTDCVATDTAGCLGGEAEADEQVDKAVARAAKAYRAARDRAPAEARVVAVGYPRMFPEAPLDDQYSHSIGICLVVGCPFKQEWALTTEEQRYLNRQTEELNAALAEEAEAAGVEFVDPIDAFAGHEFGTDDSYFHGLQIRFPTDASLDLGEWRKTVGSAMHPESLHPTAEGQLALAEVVQRQIEEPAEP